jgi:parallel beta-helix repeat protein
LAAALLSLLTVLPAQVSAAQVSCGEVITQDTKLDNDLINCPGSGIVIGADDIDLDLAGHVVDGAPGSGSGVDDSGSYDGLTVTNGTFQQFDLGIHVYEAAHVTVSKVAVADTFDNWMLFTRSPYCVIEKSTGVGSGGAIDLLESENCLVQKNTVFATSSGILLFKTNHSTVRMNSATGGSRAGIELGTANDNLVEKNSTSGSTYGIFVFDSDRNVVRANDMNANLFDGLYVTFSSEGTVAEHNARTETEMTASTSIRRQRCLPRTERTKTEISESRPRRAPPMVVGTKPAVTAIRCSA